MNTLMLKKNGIPLKNKQGNPISDKKKQRASRNAHAQIQNEWREDFLSAQLVFICVVCHADKVQIFRVGQMAKSSMLIWQYWVI